MEENNRNNENTNQYNISFHFFLFKLDIAGNAIMLPNFTNEIVKDDYIKIKGSEIELAKGQTIE